MSKLIFTLAALALCFVHAPFSWSMHSRHSGVIVRHFGIEDGLSHTHIRDMMQDSRGFMWIATWTGVDRFDGYEFMNFRTFPTDSVKLDNNRIENIAEAPDGMILVRTYNKTVYRLDPSDGSFSFARPGDREKVDSRNARHNRVREELAGYPKATGQWYADNDGNLWLARNSGLDFVTSGIRGVKFVMSNPLDSIGEDMHAVYGAAGGIEVWAAARDGRIVVYDTDGNYTGNLDHNGNITANPRATSGVKAYCFMNDRDNRLWIGTKSGKVIVRDGSTQHTFTIRTPDGKGAVGVYGMATDLSGRVWLGTFGHGAAIAETAPDGTLNVVYPGGWPRGDAARVRRLHCAPGGIMVAATTAGVVTFEPDEVASGIEESIHYHPVEADRTTSLSNGDILNITQAGDRLYFAAFSGGIDFLGTDADLLSDTLRFGHINSRNGLLEDPVMSVTRDADGCLWVASTYGLTRYDSRWNRMLHLGTANLGRKVEFTEAQPALLADSTLVFGIRGGLLFVSPSLLSPRHAPRLVLTSAESHSAGCRSSYLRADTVIHLSSSEREITLRFAALDYASPAQIEYFYSMDGGDWLPLGNEHTLRLSNLASGHHKVSIRSTDSFGNDAGNTIDIAFDVERSTAEILVMSLILVFAIAFFVVVLMMMRRLLSRKRQQSLLQRLVHGAVDGSLSMNDSSPLCERLAASVGSRYGDTALRAERIAGDVGMSRNELRREVKTLLGISVEEFVRRVRIAAAAECLDQGRYTIAEVAYRCGFTSPQYMSMVFKEQRGLTPTEYLATRK